LIRIKKLAVVLYSKLFSWNNKQVILIISSGRTGTNFMAHWFSKFSNEIYSVHEPQPDLFHLGIEKYRLKKYISNGELKRKRVMQLIRLNRLKKNIYIESNPNLILLLPELNKLFKNLKIIFIKREFDTYFLSALNKSPDNSNINYFYADNDTRHRISAKDFEKDDYKMKWSSFCREEKIAWWWKKSNDIIDNYYKNFSNSMVIKYEELFHINNQNLLINLLKFIEMEPNELTQKKLNLFKVKKNINDIKRVNNIDDLDKELMTRVYAIIK
jgi:hypothetical protein